MSDLSPGSNASPGGTTAALLGDTLPSQRRLAIALAVGLSDELR